MDSWELNHFQTEEPFLSLTRKVCLNSSALRSLGFQDVKILRALQLQSGYGIGHE